MSVVIHALGIGDVVFDGEPLCVRFDQLLVPDPPVLDWLIVSPRSITPMRAEESLVRSLVLREDARLVGPVRSPARALRRARARRPAEK